MGLEALGRKPFHVSALNSKAHILALCTLSLYLDQETSMFRLLRRCEESGLKTSEGAEITSNSQEMVFPSAGI